MCIILIGEVTKEQHELALAQNRDGFSLFTQEQGLVKKPSNAQVQRALGEFGIWHYRIGTSGRISAQDTYNIHPFVICKGKYLLYHNGILGEGLGKMSDTHALAETLAEVSVTTARSVLASLAHGSRFVLADAKDPRKFELFGEWVCDAGVLMSHRLVRPVPATTYGYGNYYKGGKY